jgi:hypothetical protein
LLDYTRFERCLRKCDRLTEAAQDLSAESDRHRDAGNVEEAARLAAKALRYHEKAGRCLEKAAAIKRNGRTTV